MGLADVPTGAGIHKPLSLTHSRPNAALRELVKNAEFVGTSANATAFDVRVWTLREFRRELGLPDRAFATVRRRSSPLGAAVPCSPSKVVQMSTRLGSSPQPSHVSRCRLSPRTPTTRSS